jgi:hypothetical protein
MYAVVYKNRVIVGPMGWNRGIFQGSLEKEGVKQTLPRVAPERFPYIVNEDAQIHRVEENRPELNPMYQFYYGPLWEITATKVIANYEVRDTSVEAARVKFKNQLADERYKKEAAGTSINIQDVVVTLDTSREGRNIFLQKYLLMGENDTVNWKFPETWLTLTKTELGSIVAVGAAHIQGAFDWEKNINDLIDAAQTNEELLEIEIVEKEEETVIE